MQQDALEDLEEKFQGSWEVKKPPISQFDFDLPVDAVVTHSSREMAFCFDIILFLGGGQTGR